MTPHNESVQSTSSVINNSDSNNDDSFQSTSGVVDLSDTFDVLNNEEWKNKTKHIFILSTSGKPIYSRYGNEDKLVTLFGVMQALVSVVQTNNDTIRSIYTNNTKYVFLIEEPLIIVTISKNKEPEEQLHIELKYIYYQILSILTAKQLKKIYEQRKNYDLRRLLSGSERLLNHLINFMSIEFGFLLKSVQCLPIQNTIRNSITQIIFNMCNKIKDIVFILLIANNKLITLIRMNKYFIDPIDLNIIFNLINSSESFKTAESWTPICLPKFDENGFLHAHVSYLADDCQACLILLTVDKNIFFSLSEAKQKLVEKLRQSNYLVHINDSFLKQNLTVSQIGIPDARHFLYKCKLKSQYFAPDFEAPYTTKEDIARIHIMYQNIYHRIHKNNLKLLYESFENEVMFGWVSHNLELYVVLEPLVSKENAISCMHKILAFVSKEGNRLFMTEDCTL